MIWVSVIFCFVVIGSKVQNSGDFIHTPGLPQGDPAETEEESYIPRPKCRGNYCGAASRNASQKEKK